jgi:hypothetical protein
MDMGARPLWDRVISAIRASFATVERTRAASISVCSGMIEAVRPMIINYLRVRFELLAKPRERRLEAFLKLRCHS